MRRDRQLRALLRSQVEAGAVSAAVALVGTPGEIERSEAAGRSDRRGRRTGRGDRFDLASLTKPFTASLALALDRRRLLPLDLPVGELWPEAPRPLARTRLESLLRHRAGFRPWTPLYRRCRDRAAVERLLLSGELLGAAPGTYSDLDYILWGLAAERATGRPLAALFHAELLRPLAVRGVGPDPGARAGVVDCRLDNAREIELAAAQGVAVAPRSGPPGGRVQDGNARFLGGLAGHAGLFAPARALWRLAAEWLRPGRVLAAGAVARALAGGGRFALGWGRRGSWPGAEPLGRQSVGHIGFTGGSLWIDPDAGRIMVLLAHRTSGATGLDSWRRRFHRLALR